jgi:hypothetical protein
MPEVLPAYVQPITVGIVMGAVRRQGWRATLQSGDRVIWRCACRAHVTYDEAYACGSVALRKRQRRPRA